MIICDREIVGLHAQSPRIRDRMGNVFLATKLSTTTVNPCHAHRCIAAPVSIIPKTVEHHSAQATRVKSFQERRNQKTISDRKRIVASQKFNRQVLTKSVPLQMTRLVCGVPHQRHGLRERTGTIRSLHATTEARRLLVFFGRAVSVWWLTSKSVTCRIENRGRGDRCQMKQSYSGLIFV
ncbi:hypothetical protein BDP81DRAFT_434847 [Colletotrichum phormii]|uniref:Uncharacterized protein n=1 Tax=Colletotrichum phormii TaxID=359342 RepID=A0AAI9ZKM1_9PEZI|nr:uncharacterized protein BDP81DRAFT_434847 [Colletotrichum phormii]KAK1633411.1 hypothetical protein BDP81DRAFT_434847 [Colletotrichum phormii]